MGGLRSRSRSFDHWLLARIFDATGPVPVRMLLEGRASCAPGGISPEFTVRIRDRGTIFNLLTDPEIGFGEAFSDGRIRIEGDLVQFLEAVYRSWSQSDNRRWLSRAASAWMEFWQSNSLRGSRKNIHHHYDLGNDFYGLWLDRQMVYTCAYFPAPDTTLEDAQIAKLDHVCRKLQLQKDETVVEAGCGWGALALHMARNYGVRVKAFNISREQVEWARRRASDEGLTARVEFIEDDYRNIRGAFDVFVSVGMLEHVGRSNYSGLGDVIHRAIGQRGRGLLHFIGRSYPNPFSRWIRKRIFPGAYAPALSEAMTIFERHGYDVIDVENLRLHYARTCEHWLARFENARDRITAQYGEWFERAWRLYLAGSIAGFSTDYLQLFQIVFAGPGSRPPAWTRAHLYAAREIESQCTPQCTPWTP